MEQALVADFNTTLQKVITASFHEGLLAKGLHEVCKGIESGKVKFVILAENVDEAQYKKLIQALCKQNDVPLLTVPQGETLGEWIKICKYDNQKEIKKARKCSSLALRNYGVDITAEERSLIEKSFKK